MEILIRDEQGLYSDHELLRGFARFALEEEGSPATTELSIALVGGEEMAGLNEKYLARQGSTDVLSFLMGEHAEEVFVLGDVVICPAEADRRGEQYGVDRGEEVLLALAHGILHLVGYDDQDEEANLEMDMRQRSLLEGWRNR